VEIRADAIFGMDSKELTIEDQPSFFGTLWQSLVSFFQSYGDTNTIAVGIIVAAIVVAALIGSEISDRRRRRRMRFDNRLRRRRK